MFLGPTVWGWTYDVNPGFYDVVNTFTVQVTDDVDASASTTIHIAITNQSVWHWNAIVANGDETKTSLQLAATNLDIGPISMF